jgi:hypothetical protein
LGICGDSTGVHIDVPGTSAVNFLLLGSKHWYYLPAQHSQLFIEWMKTQYGVVIGNETRLALQALRLFQGSSCIISQ